MAGDPLGLVYTGQDNSGAAAILNNGTINPTKVLLGLQEEERARKAKEALLKMQLAAKAAKPDKLGAIPNLVSAPFDQARFTEIATDLIKQRRPYDEGTLPTEQRGQWKQDYDVKKAGAMLLAVKSAKLWEDAKSQIEAWQNAQWRYDPGTKKVVDDWMAEPIETRQPLKLPKLNESDFDKDIQEVQVGYPEKSIPIDVGGGVIKQQKRNYWSEQHVKQAYDAWKQNKNNPKVLAFYDHVEDLMKDAHPDYASVGTKQQAQWLDEIGYKYFRSKKESQFKKVESDILKNKPKGDKVNVDLNAGGGTLTTDKYSFTYSKDNKEGQKVTDVRVGDNPGIDITPFNIKGEHVAIDRNGPMENKPVYFGPNDVGVIDAVTGQPVTLQQTSAIPLGYEVKDGKWYGQYIAPQKLDALGKVIQPETYFLYPETKSRAKLGNKFGGYTLQKILDDMGVVSDTPIEEMDSGTIRTGETKGGSATYKKKKLKPKPY